MMLSFAASSIHGKLARSKMVVRSAWNHNRGVITNVNGRAPTRKIILEVPTIGKEWGKIKI